MGADLKATLVKALIAIVLIGIVGSTCSGWAVHRVQSAYDHAEQTAERDSARARGRRDKQQAMAEHAEKLAERARGDSLLRIARRADSLSALNVARLKARPPVDTNSLAALREALHARDSIIDAQAQVIADYRVVPGAYISALDHSDLEAAAALAAANEAAHADTLSQTLGDQAEHDAHWRGVKQGVKATLITAALGAGAVKLVQLLLKGTL